MPSRISSRINQSQVRNAITNLQPYQPITGIIRCHGTKNISAILTNPCDPYSDKQDRSTDVPPGLFHDQEGIVLKKEMLIDLVICLSSTNRYVKKFKKYVLKKSKSQRFIKRLLQTRKRPSYATTKFGMRTSTSSSVFKSFSKNLKLDYNVVSHILLHLNLFPASSRMLKLRNRLLSIMCRLKELISAEGVDLELPVLDFSSSPIQMNKYIKIWAKYQLLTNVGEYLKQKKCLYRYYRGHFNRRCLN